MQLIRLLTQYQDITQMRTTWSSHSTNCLSIIDSSEIVVRRKKIKIKIRIRLKRNKKVRMH